MSTSIQISDSVTLPVIRYKDEPVVTFNMVDVAHCRPEGTSRVSFNRNKKHFIEGEDFFVCQTYEAKKKFGITAPKGLIVLTENGYLMLVKSFTDDLAWKVQRVLVRTYFKAKGEPPALPKPPANSHGPDYALARDRLLYLRGFSSYAFPDHAREPFERALDDLERSLISGWTEIDEALMSIHMGVALLRRWKGTH